MVRSLDLTDESTVLARIGATKAEASGEAPEVVMDGLNQAVTSISWRNDSMRYLFHIGDGPLHGLEY